MASLFARWRSLLGAALLSCAVVPAANIPAHGFSGDVDASMSAEEVGPAFIDIAQAATFSKQIEQALADRTALVGIVFRTGRAREDLPDGISYTHGAFWVYQPITLSNGQRVNGYAVYNLYNSSEDPSSSYLKQDFPFDFTRPMAIPEAGIIVPSPELQLRIREVMTSPAYTAMHQPRYSLISNPHDPRYQNCNEFMLDVVASALWETTDRAQIKSNLRANFTPAKVKTNIFERFFAPMADSRLVTEDHDGAIRTTTFRSMGTFLEENNLADDVFELRYQP